MSGTVLDDRQLQNKLWLEEPKLELLASRMTLNSHETAKWLVDSNRSIWPCIWQQLWPWPNHQFRRTASYGASSSMEKLPCDHHSSPMESSSFNYRNWISKIQSPTRFITPRHHGGGLNLYTGIGGIALRITVHKAQRQVHPNSGTAGENDG